MTDLVFVLIFVLLFSLVVIDIWTPWFNFLFGTTELGQSLFSLMSGTLILFYGIIWGALKIKDSIKTTRSYKKRWFAMISRASRFIGLEKPSPKDVLYISLSIFIGVLFNVLALYIAATLKSGNIYLRNLPSESYLILQYLFVAPLFEELVFRGIYLSSFLKILGSNYLSVTLGLVLSSFTFGWIHSDQLFALLIKTAGGFLLGSIYLIKWKKNFVAAFLAHIGLNVAGIYLYVVYSSF